MDYWFHFIHPNDKFPPLCLSGTAIIHEMILRGEEEDYQTFEEREALLEIDISNGINIVKEIEELLK